MLQKTNDMRAFNNSMQGFEDFWKFLEWFVRNIMHNLVFFLSYSSFVMLSVMPCVVHPLQL